MRSFPSLNRSGSAFSAFLVFFTKASGAALSLGFGVLVARTLGASSTGTYFLAVTFATYFGLAGRWGMDNVILKRVGAAYLNDRREEARRVYLTVLWLVAGASSAIAMSLYLLRDIAGTSFVNDPELPGALGMSSAAVVPIAVTFVTSEVMKATRRPIISQVVVNVIGPTMAALMFLSISANPDVEGALAAYVFGFACAALVGLGVAHSLMSVSGAGMARVSVAGLLKPGTTLLTLALMQALLSAFPMFILGAFYPPGEVAMYGSALRTAMLIQFALVALNSIVAPRFAALYERGDIRAIGRLAKKVTMGLTLVVTPVILVVIVAAKDVMALWGEEFRSAALLLAILAVGQYVNVVTGSVGYLLTMTGHEREYRGVVATSCAFVIALSFLLIPRWGTLGAAVTTALAVAALNIQAAVLVKRVLGIMAFPTFSREPRDRK